MVDYDLWDMAKAAKELIEQAKILCPEKIPGPDEALDDHKLLKMLVEVVRCSRFPEYIEHFPYTPMELSLHDEMGWLIEAVRENLSDEEMLSALKETINYVGLAVFSQIQLWWNVFDWDELDHCLDSEFLPFVLTLFAPQHLDGADDERIYRSTFGFEDSGAGVMAAAMSPYFKLEYVEEIYGWQNEEDTMRGMQKFPLTAFFLDDFGLPGVKQEIMTGQMTRNSPSTVIPWFLVPELFPELDVMTTAYDICRENLPMDPPWMVKEAMNTFVEKEVA